MGAMYCLDNFFTCMQGGKATIAVVTPAIFTAVFFNTVRSVAAEMEWRVDVDDDVDVFSFWTHSAHPTLVTFSKLFLSPSSFSSVPSRLFNRLV